MADLIILALVAVAVLFAVRRIVRQRRSGGCGCGCADCPERGRKKEREGKLSG